MRILVGTDDGLHEFGDRSSPGSVQHAGRKVSALAPGPDYSNLWAILDEAEVWRTDGPGDWARNATLEGEHLRANCIADTRPGVLVGASDARLYRVGGEGLERVQPFDKVEGRDDWYTPWGGPPDSRSISEDFDVVFVNVHVGGIVRTLDEGETWEPTIDVDADVHRVITRDGRVHAACARGLAESGDRGDTVLVSASNGPRGGRCAVYRGSRDGGPLERCGAGLPGWFDDNVDSLCLDAAPDHGLAAFGVDGRVFASTDEGSTWSEVASGLTGIRCVLIVP